ncbi:MAG: hypothetical protein HYZ28_23175 [Myxococcales bacterium]|nr:hypothetical protein [Myxococcales bacterium]
MDSDFEDTSPSGASPRPRSAVPPRTMSSPGFQSRSSAPRHATGSIPAQAPLPAPPAAAAPPAPPPPAKADPSAAHYHQRRLASSFHGEDERTQLETVLGRARGPSREEEPDGEEPTSLGAAYNGQTPAEEVTSTELWRATNAPVQSREGRRSPELYRLVIDQFAVGHNPRYQPDGPEKPRAHIFVWDVTRAMNAEVPHFVGAKELTLAQTCDWLRHEGPMRGWHRTDLAGAVEASQKGMPVLALPKEVKQKLLCVVRPDEPGPDGKPNVAAAAKQRGNRLTLLEALGVFAFEFFYHL